MIEKLLSIISPYTRENLGDKTFKEVLDHFKRGFYQVMDTVNTVGGDVHIYELNQNPKLSKWVRN